MKLSYHPDTDSLYIDLAEQPSAEKLPAPQRMLERVRVEGEQPRVFRRETPDGEGQGQAQAGAGPPSAPDHAPEQASPDPRPSIGPSRAA